MDIFVYLLGDETFLMADNVNYQLMMFIIHANCNCSLHFYFHL